MHEGGFSVEMLANGEPRFTYPDGRTVQAAPGGRFRGNAESIRAANRVSGLVITPETLTSLWLGERMDADLANLAMQSLE